MLFEAQNLVGFAYVSQITQFMKKCSHVQQAIACLKLSTEGICATFVRETADVYRHLNGAFNLIRQTYRVKREMEEQREMQQI